MATTERYLSAHATVVVQPQRPGAAAAWHPLKKDMILPDGEFAARACPFTDETVNWFVRDGFSVFFPSRMIRTRIVLEPGDVDDDRLKWFKPVFLTYDIPDDAVEWVPPKGKRPGRFRPFPNPSNVLRKFSIRVNKSDWLMDAGDVPHTLIGRIIDAGGTPRPVRLHPDDARKHIAEAILALQIEIASAMASAEQSRAEAGAQLEAATEGENAKTPEAAEKYYAQRAKSIEKRLKSLATDLSAALARFGINPQILSIAGLEKTAATVVEQMNERVKTYREAAVALRATGTSDGIALANVAERDALPVFVLADKLRDEGNDDAADALTKAFAETPADENGVYSIG